MCLKMREIPYGEWESIRRIIGESDFGEAVIELLLGRVYEEVRAEAQ